MIRSTWASSWSSLSSVRFVVCNLSALPRSEPRRGIGRRVVKHPIDALRGVNPPTPDFGRVRWFGLLIAVVGSLILAGCSSGSRTLNGAVYLHETGESELAAALGNGASHIQAANGSCLGNGLFRDVAGGAILTIRDANHSVIGTAELATGRVLAGSQNQTCAFDWTAKVPSKSFYTFEVAHHGEINLSAKDMGAIIDLELGKN